MNNETGAVLKRTPLFANLTEGELQALAARQGDRGGRRPAKPFAPGGRGGARSRNEDRLRASLPLDSRRLCEL